ncbi:hypothetical protein Dimus_029234 [Dionaea muscipula]
MITVTSRKKVEKSRVNGVDIELDGRSLATILGIPGNYGLYDYVKENLLPRFGKRDTASFMDLTYKEQLLAKLLVNLPRLMIKHMAYVISVPHHELPYGELLTRVFEAFEVPLDDKEGDEPVKTDFYDETFLNTCQLRREQNVWWLSAGANRRRDEIKEATKNEEMNQGENPEENFECEQVEEDVEIQGEQNEKEVEGAGTESVEKFFDDEDRGKAIAEDVLTHEAQPVQQQVESTGRGVDPSGSLPDFDLLHLQEEFARALQANTKFQELYQQM